MSTIYIGQEYSNKTVTMQDIGANNSSCLSRLVVHSNVRLTLIDDGTSRVTPGALANLHIIVQPGAHLVFVHYSRVTLPSESSAALSFFIQSNSTVHYYCLFTPDFCSTLSLEFHLEQAGAQAFVEGGYALYGSKKLSITTLAHHAAPATVSTIRMHGALAQKSHIVFQGMILIDEVASQSNAQLFNKNLLLSTQAYAVSIPSLEVKTNQVQCKHGSAVGRFDLNQLFYLQSRGLDSRNAKRILLDNFLMPTLEYRTWFLSLITPVLDTII